MILTPRTISILKNFSTINPSIVIQPGSKLRTISLAKNILAIADVEEQFPQEFGIFSLNTFLSALSTVEKPELHFDEKFVTVREQGARRGGFKYFFSHPSVTPHTTKELIELPSVACQFELTPELYSKLLKGAASMGLTDIAIRGENEGIFLIAMNKKNDTSNDFEIQVSEEPQKKEFEFFWKHENLKMIPATYDVRISEVGFSLFTSEDKTMTYAVALEAK